MNKLRRVIVDDDCAIQATIKAYIEKIAPKVEVVKVCRPISCSVTSILEFESDVVLMDIEIIEGTAFDVLKQTPFEGDEVFFVKGHSQYAIEALRANAIDYVMKPLAKGEFANAIDRLRLKLSKRELMSSAPTIVIKGVHRVTKVQESDVLYISIQEGMITFFLKDGGIITCPHSLSNYNLSDMFCQIHRSYVVNINAIESIESGRGGSLTLRVNKSLPVAYKTKINY